MIIFFVHFYANDVSIHGALGLTHDQKTVKEEKEVMCCVHRA